MSTKHEGAQREPEVRPWLRIRLVVDRIVAAIAALVSAPIVAVLAMLIRRDGGPGLIRVPRVGKEGEPFGMWKLRSMRAETPAGMAGGAALTHGETDSRITPIGAKMRGLHLDELPQLWNVVAGEMMLLGPRPEAPVYVDVDSEAWRHILSVPPGIAGPTQLIVSDWERDVIAAGSDAAYRSVVLPVKMAIDAWYLDTASPYGDALVGITLLRRFMPGTGSWTLRQRVFEDVPQAAPAKAFITARQAARNVEVTAKAHHAKGLRTRLVTTIASALDHRVTKRSGSDAIATAIPVPTPGVWSTEIDGAVVLFDSNRALAHHLSTEAALIWGRCGTGANVSEIADDLAEGLGLDPIQVLGDVATTVLHLTHVGALSCTDQDLTRTAPTGRKDPTRLDDRSSVSHEIALRGRIAIRALAVWHEDRIMLLPIPVDQDLELLIDSAMKRCDLELFASGYLLIDPHTSEISPFEVTGVGGNDKGGLYQRRSQPADAGSLVFTSPDPHRRDHISNYSAHDPMVGWIIIPEKVPAAQHSTVRSLAGSQALVAILGASTNVDLAGEAALDALGALAIRTPTFLWRHHDASGEFGDAVAEILRSELERT